MRVSLLSVTVALASTALAFNLASAQQAPEGIKLPSGTLLSPTILSKYSLDASPKSLRKN
jgi:hypothetical protein